MDGVNVNAHYETGILLLGMLATGLNGSYWENVCIEVVIRNPRQVNEHGPVLTQGAARRGLLRQRGIVPCLHRNRTTCPIEDDPAVPLRTCRGGLPTRPQPRGGR
jgi:hypothetical protein